jgi:hypothetical protein
MSASRSPRSQPDRAASSEGLHTRGFSVRSGQDLANPPVLPHSRLRAPHDRLRVTSLRQTPMHDGVAFTAALRLDDRRVGVTEDEGRGGGAMFRPDPGAGYGYGYGYGYDELNAFAAECRRDDQPVSTESVLADLVTGDGLARRIKRATAKHGTVLRLVGADGYAIELATVRVMPTTDYHRQLVAAELGQPAEGHWEMWNGQVWQPLTDT